MVQQQFSCFRRTGSTTSNADISFKLPVADVTAGHSTHDRWFGNLSWANSWWTKQVATIEDCRRYASTTIFWKYFLIHILITYIF